MSNEREPLCEIHSLLAVSDRGLDHAQLWHAITMINAYEAARAKDAELIQHLVNALGREVHINQPALPSSIAAFAAAEAAGFKPSQQ
jgi:hypothetical protein